MSVSEAVKQQVFALLRGRGATKAVVSYEGGNDEGWLTTQLFQPLINGEEQVVDLPPSWEAGGADETLVRLLEAPVDAKYGSFAGEFSCYGTLTWDAEAGTVVLSDNYQPHDEHRNTTEEW